MTPKFIFCIDEIRERLDAPPSYDSEGNWVPIITPGWNERKGPGHGVSGQWYYCNGKTIRHAPDKAPPEKSRPYKVFSMFFNSGHGFWVLRGDATNPSQEEPWHRLLFQHDERYSSSLTNVGDQTRLCVQNPATKWPSMLLPDIYHGPEYPHAGYGGLTGDLPIFLCLLAFSMKPDRLAHDLPRLMRNGQWGTHERNPGRTDKRGVIVKVYAVDDNDDELDAYEDGRLGKYYY